jgi:hypothetical protein
MSAKIKSDDNNKRSNENSNKPNVDKLEIVVESGEKSAIKVKPLNLSEIKNAKDKKVKKQNDSRNANLSSNENSPGVDEIELNKKQVIEITNKETKDAIQLKYANRESSPISEHKLFSAPTSTIDNFDLKTQKSETAVKFVLLFNLNVFRF